MLNAAELLAALKRRGLLVDPKEGGKIIVQPADRLTDADRKAIRALKPDLLRLLSDPDESAAIITRRCEASGADLATPLDDHAPGLLNEPERQVTPAESIIATCQRHGVTLRIHEATGDLIVGKPGARADEPSQPWPSLLRAIEAHSEPVAALVRSGWTLKARFPANRIAA